MSQSIKKEVESFLEWSRELYGPIYFTPSETPAVKVKVEGASSAPAPSSLHPLTLSSVTSLVELRALCEQAEELRTDLPNTNLVFGVGNPNADLMIVGEAPGADEDAQGLPFVGRAGQLLTKILEAIEIQRDDVYICNILKCRPPSNRKPLASETDSCEPYLWKQIELVKPRYILALGLTAANTLLKNKESMTSLRGSIHDYQGIPMVVTYHPAALLRNPEWKKATWEDVQQLARLLHTP